MIVLSLDIDGTMEFGDPPGAITLDMVREAKGLGYVVGSASDRTVSDQERLWRLHGIDVDFVGHKHTLDTVRSRYEATRWVHIGDSTADQYYAVQHGFEFWWVWEIPEAGTPGWLW